MYGNDVSTYRLAPPAHWISGELCPACGGQLSYTNLERARRVCLQCRYQRPAPAADAATLAIIGQPLDFEDGVARIRHLLEMLTLGSVVSHRRNGFAEHLALHRRVNYDYFSGGGIRPALATTTHLIAFGNHPDLAEAATLGRPIRRMRP